MHRAILLDTHAAIWLVEGSLVLPAVSLIITAGLADGVYVSPVSAWEIGLLAKPRANGQQIQFLPDPATWFSTLMGKSIIKPAPLTNEIAIASSSLPGQFHADPADRFLVATARAMNIPLMTRDRKILDYAKSGHVKIIEC
ncbi:MAG: type II toxin-antitoxin system VapC family toxin [Novosphingobium sp.]